MLLWFRTEGEDDVEWITAAFALGGLVPLKMQELKAGSGTPRDFRLEKAMGPGGLGGHIGIVYGGGGYLTDFKN
jgi:hypothetical protein